MTDQPSPLHDTDFYTWTQQQAALLRAGRLSELDLAGLAEEIEDMGRSEVRELRSILAQLVCHLLKWTFQPEKRSRSWTVSVKMQQEAYIQHMHDNPGLKGKLTEAYKEAWRMGRLQAAKETGLDLAVFPESPLWPLDTILADGGPDGAVAWPPQS